jgi:hypothetical protein
LRNKYAKNVFVTDKDSNTNITSLAECPASSGNLFAGCIQGVFISSDNGTSWSLLDSTFDARVLVVSGNNVFAGTCSSQKGIFLSTDFGTTWKTVNNGLTGIALNIISMAVCGNSIFASTSVGVYRSTNNGALWTPTNSGFTGVDSAFIISFAVSGNKIFAHPNAGKIKAYITTNNGTSWASIDSGIQSGFMSLCVNKTYLFGGGNEATGVWRYPLGPVTKFNITGTSVHGTLTATPDMGYTFSHWSGDAGGSANPLQLIMNGDKSITANFAIKRYSIAITSMNGTIGKSPDQTEYDSNTVVTLTATPTAGYVFGGWSGVS